MDESRIEVATRSALFPLGRVVATPGALAALESVKLDPLSLLVRHQSGDWGQVPEEDARENWYSLKNGFRIISSYPVGDETVWAISEWDRSQTCLCLPSEY